MHSIIHPVYCICFGGGFQLIWHFVLLCTCYEWVKLQILDGLCFLLETNHKKDRKTPILIKYTLQKHSWAMRRQCEKMSANCIPTVSCALWDTNLLPFPVSFLPFHLSLIHTSLSFTPSLLWNRNLSLGPHSSFHVQKTSWQLVVSMKHFLVYSCCCGCVRTPVLHPLMPKICGVRTSRQTLGSLLNQSSVFFFP